MDPRVNALWWDILGDGIHWTNGSRTTIGAFNITSFELIRRPVAKVIQMCGHDSAYVPRNPFPSFFLHSFIPLVCEKDFSFASQLISPYPTFPSCRHFIIPILSFFYFSFPFLLPLFSSSFPYRLLMLLHPSWPWIPWFLLLLYPSTNQLWIIQAHHHQQQHPTSMSIIQHFKWVSSDCFYITMIVGMMFISRPGHFDTF